MARAPLRTGHAEVFAGLFALSWLAARFLPLLEVGRACPFRAATGVPCATCGMTRAFVALAHGDVSRALAASPLGALLAAGAWAFALAAGLRLALGLPWPRLGAGAGRAAALVGLGALLANWAWLVVAVSP
ncbi:MAG TPA: DUF2752 domain-containing protein [Anaeromyxobacteraceae bacterium]|jgi:hypothetical protein